MNAVGGTSSLEEFRSLAERHDRIEELRRSGLRDDEVRLTLDDVVVRVTVLQKLAWFILRMVYITIKISGFESYWYFGYNFVSSYFF